MKKALSRALGNLRKASLSFKGLHWEAIRNSAIADGMELLAFGQSLVIGLHSRGSNQGEDAQATDGEQKTKGSEAVKHGFRGEELIRLCSCRCWLRLDWAKQCERSCRRTDQARGHQRMGRDH